jgi:hypothetical protein
MMRKLCSLAAPLLAVLVTMALPPAALAQMRQQPQQQQAIKQPRTEHTERLVMTPPTGWKAGAGSGSDTAITSQMFPPGQTSENWTQMLSVQVMADSQADARAYIQRVVEASRTNCEASGPSPVTEKQLNLYPAAALTVSCTRGRQSGMGGLVLAIAIRGREALYVVQRIWRGQPFDRNEVVPVPQEMLQEWAAFSKGVSLCDLSDPRHPCPQ